MERKLQQMEKIILTLCFFTTMLFFAQEKKTVVEFSKNDSIEILKMNNYIYIYIYYEKNIEYNKTKQKIQLPGDKILCKGCKNEFNVFIVSKPKKRIKNIRIIPAKEWKRKYYLGKLDAEYFMEYIKIGSYYYKVFGDVMID